MDLTRTLGWMSPSKIDCAARCLAQFYFRYVEGRRSALWGSSIVLGRAMDVATGAALATKQQTGKTPSAGDCADRFAAEWELESATVEHWDDEDTPGGLLDWGCAAAKLWQGSIAEHIQPLHMQQKVQREARDPSTGERWMFSGYLDLVAQVERTQETIVGDLKVSGRRYGADKLTRGWQPALYTWMTELPTFQYHVLVQNKTPAIQIIGTTFTPADHDATMVQVGMLRRQIRNAAQTGDWLPNRRHTLCTRRYCEHWHRCEAKFGGRVPN